MAITASKIDNGIRALAACWLVPFLLLLAAAPVRADTHDEPINLLLSACHFTTDIRESYASMLDAAKEADCETPAQTSQEMIWLSLDVGLVAPSADRDYVLSLFREWMERAVIQIHYVDGHMISYDVGPYDFDEYWSVGNYVLFPAPARDTAVNAVLVGLQNPTSITRMRHISFVETDVWEKNQSSSRTLTNILVGILFAMLFYNIALAAFLRFDFHLHYCLFVFSALAFNAASYGLLAERLPGLFSLGIQMDISIIALGLNGISGVYFLCSFIEKGLLGDRWVRGVHIYGWLFLASAFLYVGARSWHADTIDLIFNLMSAGGIIVIFATLVKAIRGGSRAALFYAAGWILPIIGVGLRVLRGLDLMPHSALVDYGLSIGTALETIVLSIGIAYRISQIRIDRDNARIDKEKAVAASHAKSDFLAHISHEIRNPMTAVIGLSELAAQTNLDEEQRDYIRNIQTSGNIMLHILDDTLDFSKIEAGKIKLEHIAFRPKEVFDNVGAIIGPKAEEKGLSFQFRGEDLVPTFLKGDPTRLSQILINLANNAVKFTDRGRVSIVFSQDRTGDDRIWLHCRVTDTGIGMNEEQIGRLFQSFSQADVSVARKYGGTGLGLVISKQLVELMGGSIGVESVPGKGSSFFFSLPFDVPQVQVEETEQGTSKAEHSPVSSPGLEGVRVLAVEDNEINRMLIEKTLSQARAIFDIASSGEDAVALLADKKYDLIVTDLNLPGMNGIETAKAIRAMDGFGHVPIIAMTGSADAQSIQACLDVGMNDYITKPFKPLTLTETLQRWHRTEQAGIGAAIKT